MDITLTPMPSFPYRSDLYRSIHRRHRNDVAIEMLQVSVIAIAFWALVFGLIAMHY